MFIISIISIFFIFLGLYFIYFSLFKSKKDKKASILSQVVGCIFSITSLIIGIFGTYYTLIYKTEPIVNKEFEASIVKWYDANKDGEIQVYKESDVVHCDSLSNCRSYNRCGLFNDADQNKDSITTLKELILIISTFDQDKNNKIDSDESKLFEKEYHTQMSKNAFGKEYIKSMKIPLVE